jgi:hypothetical protein
VGFLQYKKVLLLFGTVFAGWYLLMCVYLQVNDGASSSETTTFRCVLATSEVTLQ